MMCRIAAFLISALLLAAGPSVAAPVLSIAGTMAEDGDYDAVARLIGEAGAEGTTLTVFWDEVIRHGTYDPVVDWPAIANTYYPGTGLKITLVLPVIDTVSDRRPEALRGKGWSSPESVAAFEIYAREVLSRMPDVEIDAIIIGNEVDGLLRSFAWQDYRAFFTAAAQVVRELRPGVPVGASMTWGGLRTSAEARGLAGLGDAWMVNYYPLDDDFQALDPDTIAVSMGEMVRMAAGAPVFLTETGYPSGGCGGSPELQAEFVKTVLGTAASLGSAVPRVTLVWLHDIADAEVESYQSYYGVEGECFAGYLETLGLRTRSGQDKPAFEVLRRR